MQITAPGSSKAGERSLLCMLDVEGLAETTDERIYGKLLATDLHKSARFTDKNRPVFIATLGIRIRPQVWLFFCPTAAGSQLNLQQLSTDDTLAYVKRSQAPPTMQH